MACTDHQNLSIIQEGGGVPTGGAGGGGAYASAELYNP